MNLSRCSIWPKFNLHYTEINNIIYAEKTLYKGLDQVFLNSACTFYDIYW